ncbi:hypothetical protein [Collimonas humicola]|uniref:hypothetical protein n=1 Tax=Collimonas humicola TaxID=2825886 RepID=UPI001B8AAE0A|nr:hypothetical protein [Collimonas humicola]
MKITKNLILRIFALPACGGLIVALGLMLPYFLYTSDYSEVLGIFTIFFFVAFISAVVGWPLLALIHWKFSNYRWRYIIGGLACSTIIWFLLDMPIFPNDWHRWIDGNFLRHYPWRKLIFFSCFGLVSGSLYTGVVAMINKYVPEE